MLELLAKLRSETGRKNKSYRNQGWIPAVLYGPKVKNLSLLVKLADFERAYKQAGESALIKLKINELAKEKDKGERVVLIHDIDRDPVNDKFIHTDFYQVKMDQLIKATIPLVFTGHSAAVEKDDGVLVKNIHEIEIEVLPLDLPHEIEVDISALKTFEDHIRIKDLKIPAKVRVTVGPDEIVALVLPPRTQEELEGLEKAPVEIGEVEVVGKEKKEEEVVAEEPKKESAPVQPEAEKK